jgi:hypothetical protein
MDPLTRLALVGTARQSDPPADLPPGAGAIVTKLAELPLERRVLLAGGARAAAAMAGHLPGDHKASVLVSPPETLPPCSPKAARLIGDMLQGHHEELLAEAFGLLERARQRLPHSLLPSALRVRGDENRVAARAVLGERGAWLARMNDSWSWAAGATATEAIDELAKAWEDGSPVQRRAIFARARRVDVPRARGWLETTWASEKADEREALLSLLSEGLGNEDEAFLETQLRDRASGVRAIAQTLLARLPASAYVRRMTERADAMVDLREGLDVRPPDAVDDAAERDGVLRKPPAGVGAKEFWLVACFGAVPPPHWSARFRADPNALVAAAEASDWGAAVCEGWTRAALISRDATWLLALWGYWQRTDEKGTPRVAGELLVQIVSTLPPALATSCVEPLFENAKTRIELATALAALPTPWPSAIGDRFVKHLREEVRNPTAGAVRTLALLRKAALALPPACFEACLAPIEVPDTMVAWQRGLADFSDLIRLRNDLVQEIVP